MKAKPELHCEIDYHRHFTESDTRYQALFEASADALLVIEGGAFVDCNQAALDMLGYDSKEELYNTHPSKLSPEFQPDGQRSDSKADEMMQIALEQGSHRFEWDHLRRSGEVFPVEVLLTTISYQGVQTLHVVWRDITDRKKAQAEIEHQALYDHLTGLANRRLLLDRLKQAVITSKRHGYFGALLFIDLDRFKSINDSLGHLIGDELLVQAAKRISACIWDEDTVSRFGGDEYVVLLRHLGDNNEKASLAAEKTALRINEAFRTPFLIDGHELYLTASIGITLFPSHEESVEDVIQHADTAMYSAKQNGRNQTAYYLSEMHEKVVQRLMLERDLRIAIKENQLDIFYQPQINARNELIAVEALMRWKHPQKGFIGPDVFIPIAEETGLIFELGDFLLNKAIAEITHLNEKSQTSLKLSVNISPRQFKQSQFSVLIQQFVDKYQLEEGFLTIELTESVAIDDVDDTIKKMNELKALGIQFSLDDFGTGYSSLSLLKRLPIYELKIDKAFVLDIQHDPQDALLVQSIIKIAHQFGLKVVAEGVETDGQLTFLQRESCDIYQGYLFSKPLPLEDLGHLLAK